MRTVLIVYASDYGNTKAMAEAVRAAEAMIEDVRRRKGR